MKTKKKYKRRLALRRLSMKYKDNEITLIGTVEHRGSALERRGIIEKVCLTDIQTLNETPVADHIWVDYKMFKEYPKGSVVVFTGVIKNYVKEHRRTDIFDWTVDNISSVSAYT